jgi:hypothetical protein
VRKDRIDRYVKTIETIARSPQVDQFLIGLSRWDATRKGDSYYRIGFEHFVTIAAPLTPRDAIAVERELFRRCTAGDKRSPLYAKYHHEERSGCYHPSLGGQYKGDDIPMLVYMTCWNK